jgi:hypothetical protein
LGELLHALRFMIDWAETRAGQVAEAQVDYDRAMRD